MPALSNSPRRTHAVLVLCLAIAACSQPPRAEEGAPHDVPPTQTDSVVYHFRQVGDRYEGTIGVAFTNTTPDSVFFLNCNGATSTSIERLFFDTWIDVWHSEQDACHSAPMAIGPSAQLRRPVHVMGGVWKRTDDRTLAPGDTIGVHRLVWTSVVRQYRDTVPFGTPLEHAQRISNPFTLILVR
jgi:hypothetical protein